VAHAAGARWVGVDTLVTRRDAFDRLVRASCSRFGSDDHALVGAQVVRESVAQVVAAATEAWGRHRQLHDWRAGNVCLLPGPDRVLVGLRRLDPLVRYPALDDDAGLDQFVHQVLGPPVPAGARPPGPPAEAAAVASIVAAARRSFRSGDRHYWGTAALALVNTLTAVGHDVGARADDDRDRLLARRPDLARTVDLRTAPAGPDETVTCARRQTCCLLYRLPGGVRCGTCSLRDPEATARSLVERAVALRLSRRPAAASVPVG
jgi:hypothetical protein